MSSSNEIENLDIEIIYKPEEENSNDSEDKNIRIFGEEFVNNNKDKCKIIYKAKEYELNEYFNDIDNNYNGKDEIEIILRIKDIINNVSYMFYECNTLLSFPDNYQLNSSSITDMNDESEVLLDELKKTNIEETNDIYDEIYNEMDILIPSTLSTIKQRDVSTFNDKDEVFYKRNSLSYLINPNVKNMSFMFYGCESLKSLPDISNWKTENVINMMCLFYNCKSLISLPDISKWKTENVIDMGDMFSGCNSLISLPDISKWKTEKVIYMQKMFFECFALKSLPDISKWNTDNVTELQSMFENCWEIISLPDISKWNTEKVTEMDHLFYRCQSLVSIPDISKWNIEDVEKVDFMFQRCSSLISLPSLPEWNNFKINDVFFMFGDCYSLVSLPDISKQYIFSKDINNFYNCFNCLNK